MQPWARARRLRRRPAAGLAAALLAGCGATEVELPNLLLITVDTLRADRLACYGGAAHVGTGICSLALRGTRFVWALSPAPSTAPAIASVLTSRYPSDHGVSQFATSRLAEHATSVAEVLRAQGYATAAFVSNPVLARGRDLERGFEIYDDRMTRRERNRPGFAEREAASTSDAALAWAGVVQTPWFLWVHYQDPHGPYEPPGARPGADPPGGRELPLLEDHSGAGGIPRYQQLPGLTSFEAYAGRYLQEVRYLDVHLARLVAELDAGGRPLAVVLTADHGEALGEDDHYFAHGHSLGLEQIRVPLLVRPPGGADPVVAEHPVSTLDVGPTLLALAGIEPPVAFQGVSLVAGHDPDPAREIFSEHRLRLALVRDGLYYARDLPELREPVRDRITGGELLPLPARIARLEAGGAPPRYAPADATTKPLETALAAFAARRRPPSRETEALTGDARRRLEALGYLD